MPKVIVVTQEKAAPGALPEGAATDGKVQPYLSGERFPLQLFRIDLAAGETLDVSRQPADCVAYVWQGSAAASGRNLPTGSSVVIERGARASIAGEGEGVQLLLFTATESLAEPSPGGHVHLLPADRVPRADDLGSGSGVGGAMHADSDCPTCDAWLHENWFPPANPPSEEDLARGVHSHTEDEIIFVTGGSMRLGNRLVGPGTALAIAADTMYAFTPGPDGLSFANFRASMPGDIRFANGPSISETEYWRGKLPRPEYLEPA